METEPASTLPSDEEDLDLDLLLAAALDEDEPDEMYEFVRTTFTVCGKTFDTEGEAELFLIQEQRRAKARILLAKARPAGMTEYGRDEVLAAMQADPATFRQILDILDPEQEAV